MLFLINKFAHTVRITNCSRYRASIAQVWGRLVFCFGFVTICTTRRSSQRSVRPPSGEFGLPGTRQNPLSEPGNTMRTYFAAGLEKFVAQG